MPTADEVRAAVQADDHRIVDERPLQQDGYCTQAPFAVVLATADDVYLTDDGEKELRARQNVVLELGMVLALLGRPRVAILYEYAVGMTKPSDIDGLEYLPFKERVKEADLGLAKMMVNAGYNIDIKNV